MVIDIHSHYVPPRLIAEVNRHGPDFGVAAVTPAQGTVPALHFDYGFKVRPFFPKLIESVADRRAWLASRKIDRQLVATWPDIYGYGLTREKCAAWHRLLNETLAEWCGDNAGQFSWLASVPMPNAEDAAAELEWAMGHDAVGVMVAANIEGTNLGEVQLDAFWRQAEALKVPVVVHPVMVQPAARAARFALAQIVYYTTDTTMAAGSLIFSGVLDRFPALSIVLSHGGGALPYLIGRFDLMHGRMDRQAQGNVAAANPSSYAARMGYDTIVHAPHVLRFLAKSVGTERLALGTDYSFPPADLDPLKSLNDAGFSKDEIEAIAEHNPRRLFPRLPAT
jgi:aminocarboxymuconate-semialdehyde decarboxylase